MKTFKEIVSERYNESQSDQDIQLLVTLNPDLDDLGKCADIYANQFKPKWISLEDELPEEDSIRVLGYSAFQDEAYMCYSNTNGSERRVSGPGSVKITHWMPLPTKP